MTNYELMFIITPESTEDVIKATVEYVQSDLTRIKAENVIVTKMGEKKLAYPINKKSTGFYVLVKFNVDGTELTELERKLNINEQIMRYILVK